MNLVTDTSKNAYANVYVGVFYNTEHKDGWSLKLNKEIKYFSASSNVVGAVNYNAWILSCGEILLKYDNSSKTFSQPPTHYGTPESYINRNTITIGSTWIDQSGTTAYRYYIFT